MMDDRITKKEPRGKHIELYCVNHPEKRWSTKNISHIGARTIYYNLQGDAKMGAECDCPCRCLRPVEEPEAEDVPE